MEELSDISALIEYIDKNTAVMVYFYNDDCPPCISLRPKVESMVEDQFPRMKLVWVNSKMQPDTPAHYGIFSNPTILVFFEGKEFKRFSKYISIGEMRLGIKRIYDLLFEN
jgi:thiol-disulfide isomerase/thioredoxin